MLHITANLFIPEREIEFSAVRAQGAGGQNVNKVASAVHLRFDILGSSLPEAIKARLLARGDQRISNDGVVVIKAQEARTQDRNRVIAMERLADLIRSAAHTPKKRVPTRPSRGAKERRLKAKGQRSQRKALRKRPIDD